jgi:hypothetical protein
MNGQSDAWRAELLRLTDAATLIANVMRRDSAGPNAVEPNGAMLDRTIHALTCTLQKVVA